MLTKNKRIVFFDGTLMQGGAERVISILSRHLSERGFSVQILLLYDREIFYEIAPSVRVTVVEKESGSKNLLKNLLWVRRFFEKNADVVISFLAQFNMFALVAHTGLKSKIIVADRNDPRHMPNRQYLRKLRNLLYRFADGVVVQTSHNKEYFSKDVQKKSIVIHNPVDLGDLAGKAIGAEKKREIVSVGRLMPQKNQSMLLEAFAAIRDEFPDYVLTIYGEGPERSNLERKADELGIGDRVFLPGSVKDVHDRIISSELFVLSSDYEGMPNALIEAMCLGLPCISTKVSGATDLIRDGENGLLIEVGDCDEMKGALRQMLLNEELRERSGKQAVLLNDALETEKITAQWIEAVESVIDQ